MVDAIGRKEGANTAGAILIFLPGLGEVSCKDLLLLKGSFFPVLRLFLLAGGGIVTVIIIIVIIIIIGIYY